MKIMDIIDDKYTKKSTWIKDGILMCNKECCGAPVSECSCDSSCKKCNCYNLKENKVVEAIPKSTMYGLVIDGEYVAKGSKADMRKLQKQKGGTVYNAPGKKVGDKEGVVKEGVKRNILYREIGKRLAKGHTIDKIKKHYKDIDDKYPGHIEKIVQALKDRNEIPEKAGVVKERYGMRQGGAQSRDAQDDAMNMNKRANNRAIDQNREQMIKAASAQRLANKRARQIPTGLPNRLLNPQQPQAPTTGQS